MYGAYSRTNYSEGFAKSFAGLDFKMQAHVKPKVSVKRSNLILFLLPYRPVLLTHLCNRLIMKTNKNPSLNHSDRKNGQTSNIQTSKTKLEGGTIIIIIKHFLKNSFD